MEQIVVYIYRHTDILGRIVRQYVEDGTLTKRISLKNTIQQLQVTPAICRKNANAQTTHIHTQTHTCILLYRTLAGIVII